MVLTSNLLNKIIDKEAFIYDVIIGGGSVGKMTECDGCRAKDDFAFLYDFWEKFQQINFKKFVLL